MAPIWSCGLALAWLFLILFAGAKPALAVDDNENSTPTAWWFYTGQTVAEVSAKISKLDARIVDIKVDNASANDITVALVENTGAYAKQWWWYVGVDEATLNAKIKENNGRLISVQPYDIGGGNIRFAAVMISNTGADAKAWWWYFGQSASDIATLTSANKARLTTLRSYESKGQTYYAFLMIANSGADEKAWWYYYGVTPKTISSVVSLDNARLLDLTSTGNGSFNIVMESCDSGCPGWWWWYGQTAYGVLSKAQDYGARVQSIDTYQTCGSGPCFAAVMIANTPPDIKACDNNGCISEAKFLSGICNALADQVVGYDCLVGGLAPIFGGVARTSADPPSLAMAPDLVTDIASVSKTMTTVAILQLLAKDHLTIDTKISHYIYSDWKLGPNVDKLTFKDLLTHSSGFGQLAQNACEFDITYFGVRTVVAGGVAAGNIGVPKYGNCNFALLRELMPALRGQSLLSYANGSARAAKSSADYIAYINANVFQPAGVPTSACAPPAGTDDILSYTNPAGSSHGTNWGDWSLMCGSGGWVLSANQIFDVIDTIANSTKLLTAAERQSMFQNCLGWDCSVRSDCPDPYVCKNGDLNNGAGISVWTYAGIFKCNVPVVVVVNSPLPPFYQNGSDIIGLVENAYLEASVSGTGQACP